MPGAICSRSAMHSHQQPRLDEALAEYEATSTAVVSPLSKLIARAARRLAVERCTSLVVDPLPFCHLAGLFDLALLAAKFFVPGTDPAKAAELFLDALKLGSPLGRRRPLGNSFFRRRRNHVRLR
jgi:hypothetical protein